MGSLKDFIIRYGRSILKNHPLEPGTGHCERVMYKFRVCGSYDLIDPREGQGIYYIELMKISRGLLYRKTEKSIHLIQAAQFFDSAIQKSIALNSAIAREVGLSHRKSLLVGQFMDFPMETTSSKRKGWIQVDAEIADSAEK